MPLIRDEGVSPHGWRFAGAEDGPLAGSHLVAPPELLDEVLAGPSGIAAGLALANTADLDAIVPHFGALALITVDFPSFADGRGFSLARRIRALGYEGELWARGHLIPDQYAFARSCGFDAVLVDETVFQRQGEADWRDASRSLSLRYQAGGADWAGGPRSILELRRSAVSIAAE